MSVKKKVLLTEIKNRGHYTVVPNEILASKELSGNEKLIWCYILSQSGTWTGGRNSIATNLGISPKTVSSALDSLVTKNLLIITSDRSKFSFEYPSSSQWSITVYLPQSKVEITPKLEQDLPHIKEVKKNKASQPISSAKEEDLFHLILSEWRKSYPSGPGFLSGKSKARPALKELIKKSKIVGLQQNDLKPDAVIALIFGSNPDSSLQAWILDIRRHFNDLVTSAYDLPSSLSEDREALTDEARLIFEELKSRNVTPADLNGMSVEEHAAIRAYANQFPILDTSEAIKNWKQMTDGPTVEEMMATLEDDILDPDG